jgi:hypothetical protein
MTCKNCGSKKLAIYKTDKIFMNFTLRYVKCLNCHDTWQNKDEEIAGTRVHPPPDLLEEFKRLQKKKQQKGKGRK